MGDINSMSLIKEIWRPYIWQEIKENRDGYFVSYNPINLKSYNFAMLNLVFTTNSSTGTISSLMETELDYWINRYPLPIMISAFDYKGNKIALDDKPNSELLGYFDKKSDQVIKSWNRIDKDFPSFTDEEIYSIYKGLKYETIEQKEKKRDSSIKEHIKIKKGFFFIYLTFVIWAIISFIIAYLGWQNYWIGMAAFLYSTYKAIRRLKEIFRPTKKNREENEKKRKMEFYYQQCELNPEGFQRLKAENFERDIIKEVQGEKTELEKVCIDPMA